MYFILPEKGFSLSQQNIQITIFYIMVLGGLMKIKI